MPTSAVVPQMFWQSPRVSGIYEGDGGERLQKPEMADDSEDSVLSGYNSAGAYINSQ